MKEFLINKNIYMSTVSSSSLRRKKFKADIALATHLSE